MAHSIAHGRQDVQRHYRRRTNHRARRRPQVGQTTIARATPQNSAPPGRSTFRPTTVAMTVPGQVGQRHSTGVGVGQQRRRATRRLSHPSPLTPPLHRVQQRRGFPVRGVCPP